MRRVLSLIPLLFVLALFGPDRAGAQEIDPNTPVSSSAESATPVVNEGNAAVVPAVPPTGVERAAPPRTLRAYWHVFIAFALAWVLLFGYALSLGRRFARLEREVEVLHGETPAV
jgi:CcmD family protein